MRLLCFVISLLVTTFTYANNKFTIMSNNFHESGAIPIAHTCDGEDTSPQLSWKHAPTKTVGFALVMFDPDAPNGGRYHWIVYNIPKTTTVLAENSVTYPAGTIVGENASGKRKYDGPCPPKGTTHRYIFTLYALNTLIKSDENLELEMVLEQIKSHSFENTKIMGTYSNK